MKLKSLIINGFKSFADKTQIDFQDGMTAIVGPNGSGKSNVIEAIRWVLGEQSAKNLRGEKMPDVIFAGTDTRAPLNRAEVEIIFDNKDHYLPLDEDEIAIARRIYRNGDSEFLLNGKQVRLKDITGLMLDTGLGRESFSIISQGRVESIFNSKPEERRVIIEEVAGVLKYKKEKQKAQQELAETADHLNRVADIVVELQMQREPLKEQSSIARDYLEQKKDFDHYNLSKLVLEIAENKQKKVVFEGEIAQLEAVKAKNKKQIEQYESSVNSLHKKQDELNHSLDRLQEEAALLTGQKERYSGKKEITQKEKDYQLQKITEVKAQKKLNQEKLKQVEIERMELIKQIKDLTEEQTELQRKVTDLTELHEHDANQIAAEIEDLRQQIITKMQEQTSLKNQALYLTKEEQRNKASKDIFLKKTKKQQENIQTLKKKTDDLKLIYEEKCKLLEIENKRFETEQDDLSSLQVKLQQQKDSWYKALAIVQRAQAQHDSLKNIDDNFAGYYRGVKEILQKRAKFAGIIGAVAELLDVPSNIAYAIEIALGSQTQNVVVENEQAAKAGINYLVKNRLGRVTFLPRNTVRQRKLSKYQSEILAKIPGVLGIGNQLVKCAKDDQPILNYLLGTTVIVEDIDIAVDVARKLDHSLRVVSLAGDVVNPGGAMTGGANKQKNSGLIEQKERIKTLENDLAEMKQKMKKIELQGANAKKDFEQKKIDVQMIEKNVAAKKEESHNIESQLVLLKNQLRDSKEALELQQEEFEQEIKNDAFGANKNSLAEKQAILEQKINKLRAEFDSKKNMLTKLNEVKEQNTQKGNDMKRRLAIVTERLSSLNEKAVANKKQINEYQDALQDEQKILDGIDNKQKIDSLKSEEIVQQLRQINEKQEAIAIELTKGKKMRADIHEYLQSNETELTRVNNLQELTFNKQREKSIKLSKVNGILDQSLSELAQTYELTYEAAKAQNKEHDLKHVLQKLKLLRLGIEELGEVNIGSIDEYERVNERFEFLSMQQNDLLEAKKQLQKSMQEMDNEVKIRFGKTFKAVADAFTEVFPQMFGGGKASLKLTDSSDLLTTGIEIMAQPPGKKLQKLSLLSGGEKALTALTLLFAILKVKPVPFAILDEAEAALDDANVDRYSSYLQNFHDQTQFIIITHRKGTMSRADILYGVTMQESGISRTVSVSLENILEENVAKGG
ncbi:chromosome segregation protein SMC [Liquorilactobacillus mali]|uniref:Chromosome partition protein Smc n=1 Tax=Liquorilactobacillus mali KCTC 3596 = DSM 20444 TaxID=1046596 RepID=J0UQH3_9LACO|nr:chromosome segregation protein SMC [Liquorilactobacillus mali]EJE98209.1 chromosome partition protein [Liquorilactobacillus mali KCTC 3596 = DSM 20444]KRN09424.1 chromosome partition protein [Liquorilactobacillus mali KCTC 3596 = DSM 20444]MDC7951931.1 chromosome segregation protein SMC [Liquorilactobacillus mali]QFQ75022.1 chromosome segregation protein SMC [Liquorilactobacillus mali]